MVLSNLSAFFPDWISINGVDVIATKRIHLYMCAQDHCILFPFLSTTVRWLSSYSENIFNVCSVDSAAACADADTCSQDDARWWWRRHLSSWWDLHPGMHNVGNISICTYHIHAHINKSWPILMPTVAIWQIFAGYLAIWHNFCMCGEWVTKFTQVIMHEHQYAYRYTYTFAYLYANVLHT